jgi:hypothetical protein
MDELRRQPFELPRFLYREGYSGSKTTCTASAGLEAANTTTVYRINQQHLLKLAVENHFTWAYRGHSHFISLFSEGEHAWNWASMPAYPGRLHCAAQGPPTRGLQ